MREMAPKPKHKGDPGRKRRAPYAECSIRDWPQGYLIQILIQIIDEVSILQLKA